MMLMKQNSGTENVMSLNKQHGAIYVKEQGSNISYSSKNILETYSSSLVKYWTRVSHKCQVNTCRTKIWSAKRYK